VTVSARTWSFGSDCSRSVALCALLSAALVGGCATAVRAPKTTEAEDRSHVDPNSAAAHASRGSALIGEGKLEQALAEFREASRLDPTNSVLWLQLSQVYELMGRGEEALNSLETGLQADPGNAGILNQLGWLYATSGDPSQRDPEKAVAYAQRAVEASNGRDANILDTLAEAYYANRDFDRAIEAEERALEIEPGSDALRIQLQKFREAKALESVR